MMQLFCPIAFARDGTRLLSMTEEEGMGLVCQWDVGTGQQLRRWRVPGKVNEYRVFSADGSLLASRESVNGQVGTRLWDIAAEKERWFVQQDATCLAFSPDGKILAATAEKENTIQFCDVATGKVVQSLRPAWVHDFAGSYGAMVFSPDGKLLVTAGREGPDDYGKNGLINLWDVASGQRIKQWSGQQGWIVSLAFSPDSRSVVSAALDGTAVVWDVTGLANAK
jgi:WD40 repeat protein